MNKKRLIAAGGVVVAALAFGTGLAVAQTGSGGAPSRTPVTTTVDHDAIHQQMRSQMPADLQQQCDEMHAQMSTMQDGTTGMMGSTGASGPSGMMGSRSS